MEPVALAAIVLAPSVIYEPRGALTALLLLAGSAALGAGVLTKLDLWGSKPLVRILFSVGTGLGLLMFLLLLVGLVGLYFWPVFVLLLGIPVLAFRGKLRELGGDLRSLGRTWAEDPGLGSALVGTSVFFVAVSVVVAMILILAPSVAHDSLMMHIPAARHYASEHALTPLPFQSYSYYPQGIEVLMTAAYVLGGRAAVQFVHPIFFLLTLGAVASIGRCIGTSRSACFLVVATLFTIPFLLWTGAVPKNDLAMAAFQMLAILCGISDRDGSSKPRLRLGIFFLASSLAIKYTAFFGAPWIAILFLYRIRDHPRRLREIGIWGAIAVVFALSWQVRAYVLTGNPLFPARFSRLVGHVAPGLGTGDNWNGPNYLEIVAFVHFTGTKAFKSPSENPVGFFLILTLPIWVQVKSRRWNRKVIALWCLCGCYYLLWGAVYPFLRYGIVPLAIVMLLACQRFESLYEQSSRALRIVLLVLVEYNFLFCLLPSMINSLNGPQILLFAKQIDKAEYLRRALEPYGALEFLQREAERDDLILGAWVTAAGYAPESGAFHPMYFRSEIETQSIGAALMERNYGFLVAPDSEEGRGLTRYFPANYRSTLAYEDGKYLVFRLETSPATGG